VKKLKHRGLYLGFAVFFICLYTFSKQPHLIDAYYVSWLYPIISGINQGLWARFPFSIGDLGYLLFGIFLIWQLFRTPLRRLVQRLLTLLTILLFLFYSLWGMLYFKTPLRTQKELKREISTELLYNTTKYYANKVSLLHESLSVTNDEKIILPQSNRELLAIATKAMEASALRPKNVHGKAKATLFPTVLSYMGFGGYANPFTHEAQVNTLQPKLSILSTSCHEIAHQWGYAAEDEANYIGIKASISADEQVLIYAGTFVAFRYLINSLYRVDKEAAEELLSQLPKGIRLHMVEMRAFWQKYQNPFEPIFEKSYDQYLKANQQQAGIQSYSLVVGLLVDDFAANRE
jgi:hypothetical protein